MNFGVIVITIRKR